MGNPHRERAISALIDRNWHDAADAYTLAAHRDLGEGRGWNVLDPGTRERPAHGLSFLTQAALCYRLADADDRACLRSMTALPLAIDGRDHVREGVARAVCQEFVGDARAVIGRTEKATAAYERAATSYREQSPADPLDAAGTPLFSAANRLTLHISRNTGTEVRWDDLHGSDPTEADYLAHRAVYKRKHLPRIVDAVLDAGRVHVPRGTTEYNNDNFRCPDCGSRDVNWVADETVCLHCSVRVTEAKR
jgi:hypothetical protein